MLAFAMMAASQYHANKLMPKNQAGTFIRWSIQEICRAAHRLARRRIGPAYVIAWSLWQRAHQAAA